MKIAVFFDLPSGGAKRTTFDIVRGLSKHHQIDVFTYSVANHTFGDLQPFTQKYRVLPVNLLAEFRSPFGRLNPLVRMMNLWVVGRSARQVAREIDRSGYDLAFIQPCQFEYAPSVLRLVRSTPTIFYCHEPPRAFYEIMPPRPYDGSDISRRKILNQVDPLPKLYRKILLANDYKNVASGGSILVNSRYMAGQFEKTYHRKAQVCYMGIDANAFTPQDLPREEFFLSVGSLTRLKGFDFLIRSLGQVALQNSFPLVIASNFQVAEERHYLECLAKDYAVKVNFLDSVSDGQLSQLYNRTCLTLYSPVREPFGLVPVESMSCSTPVVTVNEGGVAESVVNNETGLLVERIPASFAAAVKRMVDNPGLRREYGVKGRETVLKNWSWEVILPRIENIFLESARGTPKI